MDHSKVPSAPPPASAPIISPPSYDEAVGIVSTDQIQVDASNVLNNAHGDSQNQLEDESKKKAQPPVTAQPQFQPIPQTQYTFPPPVQPVTTSNDCCLWCIWCDGDNIADLCYCLFCCSRHASGHDAGCCDCSEGCCECDGCDCDGCDCDGCDCDGCDCGDCDCDCGDCTIL